MEIDVDWVLIEGMNNEAVYWGKGRRGCLLWEGTKAG